MYHLESGRARRYNGWRCDFSQFYVPCADLFHLSFYPLFSSYWIVFGLFALLSLVLTSVKPNGDRLSPFGQRFLLGLRLLSLLILLFAMLRPTFVLTEADPLASTLQILLDQSESMTRPDEAGGKTRFEAAVDALINAQPELKTLQTRSEVKFWGFDGELTPYNLKRDGTIENLLHNPKGRETAIGHTLDVIRERSFGKRLLGVVLISDGAQRSRPPRTTLPQDAAIRLRDAGIAVYPVRLGQAGDTNESQDIAVVDVQANEHVFVKNEWIVSGSIRVAGYPNQPIPLQLYFEDENGTMRLVQEERLTNDRAMQILPYKISYRPQQEGYFKYTVRVPPQPKELLDTNNEQSGFVRVIPGGLSVLFIQGGWTFEQGRIRNALATSPDISVEYRSVRLPPEPAGTTTSNERRLEAYARQRPSWVTDGFEQDRFNVFMLGDIDVKAFKAEELQALADRVREGAGLVMLGGLHSFGAGGYADTPLAEISPVQLWAVDRQPLDGPIRQDIHWQGTIPVTPTERGRVHYVLRFDPHPARNAERWQALPPIEGANKLGNLKGGATLLAKGTDDNQRLIVSQLYGKGRVLAFAGDSTYRWQLAGFTEEHRLFWRQVILWLAKMDGVMDGDCWISVDNSRLMPGEPVEFQVLMQSPTGEEIPRMKGTAIVVNPKGVEEKVSLVDSPNGLSGSYRSTEFVGDYTITVEVVPEPNPTDISPRKAKARVMVTDRNIELDNPVAYPQMLESLANVTGGKTVVPEQLRTLLKELIQKSETFVEKRETKLSLYDSWALLVIFIAVLSLEWFLRKRWGLV